MERSKMKTLGMIGGTSWHSTIEYYRFINQMVGERTGNPPANPPLLLYSLNVDLMRRGDWDEINAFYLKTAQMLQTAGAEAILICANTPHKVVGFVAPRLDIPILHIADATAREAQKLGLSNLGLLGTKPVTEGEYITGRLFNNFQIKTLVPEEPMRNELHRMIVEELTQGIFKEDTKAALLEIMQEMKRKGADGIILGCTELPIILKPEDFGLPLLNTTYLHAQMAVDFIAGELETY